MFLIQKTYPNSDRIAWWDGSSWVDHNHYAIEFPQSQFAHLYAETIGLKAPYLVAQVTRKDQLPLTIPITGRNGESNPRPARGNPND